MTSSSTISDIDKITALLSESIIYGALAKALSDGSTLKDGALIEELAKAANSLSNPQLIDSIAEIRSILNHGSWDLEALRLEHTRLFVKGESLPYETSFDKNRPFGKTQELADIAGFYKAFGVKTSSEFPDHIVCELEYMSLLCLKEVYALAHSQKEQAEVYSTAQRKFIAEHLGRWLKSFSEHIRKTARLPIYPALIDLTYQFVTFHANSLGVRLTSG